MANGERLTSEHISKIDWKSEQSKDPCLSRVVDLLRSGSLRGGRNTKLEPLPVQKFFREYKNLIIENDILYRTTSLDGQQLKQLVLPDCYRKIAIRGIHNDAGHQGKEKSLWLARQRFYWPGLEKDLNHWIEHCDRCIRRKTPVNRPLRISYPLILQDLWNLLVLIFETRTQQRRY